MFKFWERKFNYKEPEVAKAGVFSLVFFLFLTAIDFYAVFIDQIEPIRSLILAIVGGLLGLMGLSIAGVAIALSMFTAKEIRAINDWKEYSFTTILETFKHFAYDVIVAVILLIALFLLMLTNIPAPSKPIFYTILLCITYYFFYVLFYGWALLGNYVALSNIKSVISQIESGEKSTFDSFNEVAIEQLVEIIYRSSGQDSKSFYSTLLKTLRMSSHPQKDGLIAYIEEKYLQ